MTRTARTVTVTTNGRRNAVGNARSRAQRLCDRREDPSLTAEEEDGARRAGAALRAVAGVALEARKGAPLPDAADAAADRARLQRRPRLFLRWRAREAARGGGPQGGARAAARASGWEGHVLLLRVARLPRDRAAVQLLLRRVPSHGARERPAAHARGRGVHLHPQGQVERSHRRP